MMTDGPVLVEYGATGMAGGEGRLSQGMPVGAIACLARWSKDRDGNVVSATSSPVVMADLMAGKGVRVVTYGTGADVIEEMQARIRALEAAVAERKRK